VNWKAIEIGMRRMASLVTGLALCVPAATLLGQHKPAVRPAPMHQSHAASAPSHPSMPQPHSGGQPQNRGAAGPAPEANRPQPAMPATVRPAYPVVRPGSSYPGASQPGHLGEWLNQHQGLPAQEQERLLHHDPNFNRLAPQTQQRLIDQLHQLNQMPDAQRQRRLARSEMLERMSPQEQMQVREAGRSLLAMPTDRQVIIRNAYRDLSSVPLDQRETVLNSARYQSVFTPGERGILSTLLRAEPYAPR